MKTATRIAAVSAAVMIAGATFLGSAQQAEAGNRDFWKGVGAAVVTGIVIHEIVRHNNSGNASVYEAHVAWCYDNRPRYRESDNTFRYTGHPRTNCVSPYGG